MRVGIVSCDKYKNKIIEDLMLKNAFTSLKISSDIISWEKDDIDKYNILVLRSIWGYQHKYNKFIEWLNTVKQKDIALINNYGIVSKCIDKEMQYKTLSKNNIPIIPYKVSE